MKTLYLCGAGNPEGVRLAQRVNQQRGLWDRIVLLDDDPAKHGCSIMGVDVCGSFEMLKHVDAESSQVSNMVARTTMKRWSALEKIKQYGLEFAHLEHPSAETDGAVLGEAAIVYQNATVGAQASLGDGCVVFMGAVAGHGCELGPGCVLAPNAVVNARARLGEGVYVGTNATILPEVKVGPWATIGAGSAVMQNVPAGATVMGVPGRVVMTLELKIKTGGLESVPPTLREQWKNGALAESSAPAAAIA